MRILGLDFGTKTVGVAVSDELLITAQGVEIIRREKASKLRQTLARIEELVKQYNEWLVSLNTEVRVLDPQGEYSGISRGINENGELLVDVPDGKIEVVYAGEVSVRGLYGYV